MVTRLPLATHLVEPRQAGTANPDRFADATLVPDLFYAENRAFLPSGVFSPMSPWPRPALGGFFFRRGRWIFEALGQRVDECGLSAAGDTGSIAARSASHAATFPSLRVEIAVIGPSAFRPRPVLPKAPILARASVFELRLSVRGFEQHRWQPSRAALRPCSLRVGKHCSEPPAGYRMNGDSRR